ncbi:hypothetical protein H5410_046351, partial [Solanum commersonii]
WQSQSCPPFGPSTSTKGPVKLGEVSDHSAHHRVGRRSRLTSPNGQNWTSILVTDLCSKFGLHCRLAFHLRSPKAFLIALVCTPKPFLRCNFRRANSSSSKAIGDSLKDLSLLRLA